MLRFSVISAASFALASAAFAASPEVRGTWVTTTGLTTGNISSNLVTATSYSRMRGIGLNTTYTDLWRAGYSQFNSPTMSSLIGIAKDPALGSRDIARETTMQAHRNGMLNLGWFQYGFATQYQPPTSANQLTTYMANKGWLLKDSAGAYWNSSSNFAWMNPLVPEVRSLLTNVVLDAVKQYDLDGVQFDDRLAWPIQFGYDDYTKNVYKTETGRDLPTNSSDSNFKAWRAAKITSFAQQFIADIKAKNPALIVSVAPSVYPFGYDSYCANYPDWTNKGMFDEIIPQVYRNTAANFDGSWDGVGSITNAGQVQFMGSRRGDFAAGISFDGSAGLNPWSELQPMINQVRATTGVAGHVLWYSSGVLNNEANLTSFYNVAANGQADRPDTPTGWRPAPTIASQVDTTTWQANVPAKGRYLVVYKNASGWFEFTNTVLLPGTVNFSISSVTNVELLVDRRFVDGDANFDFVVNSTDFTTMLANYGTTSAATYATGDFTGDGKVNALDFNILAANFGKQPTFALPAATLGAIVPEPAMISLSTVAISLFIRNRRSTDSRPL